MIPRTNSWFPDPPDCSPGPGRLCHDLPIPLSFAVRWAHSFGTHRCTIRDRIRHSLFVVLPRSIGGDREPTPVHCQARHLIFASPTVYLTYRSRSTHARRSSFLPLSAWHSLRLKPCARRRWPFCFSHTPRALRVSAPPATFQPSRTRRSMKSCRSPRKSTPTGLGAAASLSGCPSETGRKGVPNACTSTA